jgi:transcription-repair coupling factor (superfamily II helicase)
MYKRLAEVRAPEQIDEVKAELEDRYGTIPTPVANLLAVANLRVKARKAGLTDINGQGNFIRFTPVDVLDSARVRLDRLYPKSVVKQAVRSVLVPRPAVNKAGAGPMRDAAVLDWAGQFIDDMGLTS